jgi:hypothetical protein
MAGGEDEAQRIVVERIVDLGLEVGALDLAADLELAPELLRLSLVDGSSAQVIDSGWRGSRRPRSRSRSAFVAADGSAPLGMPTAGT